MSSPVPSRVEFTPPPMPQQLPEVSATPAQRRPRRNPEEQRRDRAHARRGNSLEARLNRLGIHPGMVAPTRDRRGHIRLNFDDVEQLLRTAEAAAQAQAAGGEK